VSELHKSASSLALSSSSRAISLSSCLICFSRSIALISRSTTGRQFSVDNQRRQRGSDERYADLLIELDDSNEGEFDMAIGREQRDQGQQQAGHSRDPALAVELKYRSQPTKLLKQYGRTMARASVEALNLCACAASTAPRLGSPNSCRSSSIAAKVLALSRTVTAMLSS